MRDYQKKTKEKLIYNKSIELKDLVPNPILIKNINHDKTIGIIICRENNQYVIKYCSDSRIISRTYKFI